MADLTAVERIAAEALADLVPIEVRRRSASRVVAALSAAGWLVEPVQQVEPLETPWLPGEREQLRAQRRWQSLDAPPRHAATSRRPSRCPDDEVVSPAAPGTAPPAPSPP